MGCLQAPDSIPSQILEGTATPEGLESYSMLTLLTGLLIRLTSESAVLGLIKSVSQLSVILINTQDKSAYQEKNVRGFHPGLVDLVALL